MSESRFFELLDHVGVDHDGNLEPLTHAGYQTGIPTISVIGLTETLHSIQVAPADELGDAAARFIPKTRIVECGDALACDQIIATGLYREIDPPTKADISRHEKETKAHVEAMNRRDELVAAGELEPPDAADHDVNPDNLPQAGEEA